jgi:DNA-binding CsgD family transcriptional regulator/tetratricopeptide (TPR) repeat protein
MWAFRSLFRRTGPAASLRVRNGDAFAACAERFGITAREGEIIRLLLEGKDNKRITEELFISDHTVKNHIHNIYRKLGVRNRVQLVRSFQPALEETGHAPVAGPAPVEGLGARLRRATLPAVLVLGVAAVALVAWKPWQKERATGVVPPAPALAVLDFENVSGDPDLEKWATGFPTLLTTDLLQSRRLRTVGSDLVYGALRKHGLAASRRFSREELRRLSRELKADYLLCGSLMKAGNAIVVTTFLQDARTGDTVRTDRIVCADEQGLLDEADALVRQIKSGLAQRSAPAGEDVDLDVEDLTTSYALAYRYYAEALRYHATGDYEQSLLMLKKAVELDPQFAMAYRLMSVDARNLGYYAQEIDYMRTAFDLSGRLPENSRERHLIRACYYSLSETAFPLAVEAYQAVLEGHPDDIVANNNLAMLYFDLEDYAAAARCAEVPIRRGTDNPFPYHTRAISLNALGRGGDAVRLLESYHAEHPANRLVYETLLDIHIDNRDFTAAGAVLERAVSVFPDPSWSYWRGTVLFHTRGGAAAGEEFRRLFLMEEAPWFLKAHAQLGAVAMARGKFREAAEEFGKGAEVAETTGQHDWVSGFRLDRGQACLDAGDAAAAVAEAGKAVEAGRKASQGYRLTVALTFLATAHLAAGDAMAAEATAAQSLVLAVTGKTPRLQREHEFLRGLIELEAGRPAEAVKLIEKAVSRIARRDHSDGRIFLYGRALAAARERAGDAAGAAEALRTLVGSPGDILRSEGRYALAVFDLARLDEKLGRADAAREGYRAFLELWKDADAGRREIEEARGRLSSLPATAGKAP